MHRAPKVFMFSHSCAELGVNRPASVIGSFTRQIRPNLLKMADEHTVEARIHAHGKQRQVFPHTPLGLDVGDIRSVLW